MTESTDTTPGCSHDADNFHGDESTSAAVSKRRLFNPFRSLKRLFGHRGKSRDSEAVTSPLSQCHPVSLQLTPDVTTCSSTDNNLDDIVTSPAEHIDEPPTGIRKKPSARRVSQSLDSVIPEDKTETQRRSEPRVGLKLGRLHSQSSDVMASKATQTPRPSSDEAGSQYFQFLTRRDEFVSRKRPASNQQR